MPSAASQVDSPNASVQGSVQKRKPKAGQAIGGLNARGGSVSAGGSIQALLDQGDIPDLSLEPGPGYYFHPESSCYSSFAEQKFSKCASAPEFSLPKTGWDEWKGTIISKDHNKLFAGKDSPGAIYQVPDGLNRKAAKIGTSVRPNVNLTIGDSPGPSINICDVRGQSMGELSHEDFGKSRRFTVDKRGQIGPGQYARKDFALNSGTGKSIGVGRSAYDKVITPGYESENQCRASPGVGPPLWKDWENTSTKNKSSNSLGRANRFPKSQYENCSPGPGAYQNDKSTDRGTTTSFGSRPKKPRFRALLAQQTAKNGGWGYF